MENEKIKEEDSVKIIKNKPKPNIEKYDLKLNPYIEMIPDEIIGVEMPTKDFMQLIKEPYYEGLENRTQQRYQLKELEKYMDIRSKYKKTTVYRIYSSSEVLNNKNKAKLSEYVADAIIICLKNSPTKTKVIMTYRELATYVYLVNEFYYPTKYNKIDAIEGFKQGFSLARTEENPKEIVIYEDMCKFFETSDKIIRDIINSALNALVKKSVITLGNTHKLYKRVMNPDTNKWYIEEYICNDEQEAEFNNIQKMALEKNNLKDLQQLAYCSFKTRNSFYDDLTKKIGECDMLHNCDRYAKAKIIIYGDKAVDYEIKRIKKYNQKLINANMQFKLLTSSEVSNINTKLLPRFIEEFIC